MVGQNADQSIAIKIIHEENEAREAWRSLSPKHTIYDEWNFRYCYNKYFGFELYFFAAYEQDVLVALLPLVLNNTEKCLEFIGGIFMYDNRVFVKDGKEYAVPALYNALMLPARLHFIVGQDSFTTSLPVDDYKFTYNLSEVSSFEDFMVKSFNSKVRNNLKRKIKFMEMEQVSVVEDNFSDLDILMDLNIKQFNEKSSFNKPHRKEIYRDLLGLGYPAHMLSFVVNGKKEAVSLAFVYQDKYIYLNLGKNIDLYPHLGGYVTLKNIEKAISLGCKEFDAGIVDLGWKKEWGMIATPECGFTKM